MIGLNFLICLEKSFICYKRLGYNDIVASSVYHNHYVLCILFICTHFGF